MRAWHRGDSVSSHKFMQLVRESLSQKIPSSENIGHSCHFVFSYGYRHASEGLKCYGFE